MQDLIEKLENAPEGSRELDADVAGALGCGVSRTPAGEPVGYMLDASGEKVVGLPFYTTSIDAGLPGEDIKQVARLSNGMWWARDSRLPEEIGMVARTEPLARRIAALKALAAEKEART